LPIRPTLLAGSGVGLSLKVDAERIDHCAGYAATSSTIVSRRMPSYSIAAKPLAPGRCATRQRREPP
jgi:hypothetical protein